MEDSLGFGGEFDEDMLIGLDPSVAAPAPAPRRQRAAPARESRKRKRSAVQPSGRRAETPASALATDYVQFLAQQTGSATDQQDETPEQLFEEEMQREFAPAPVPDPATVVRSARAAATYAQWQAARPGIGRAYVTSQGVPEPLPLCCACGSSRAVLRCLDCERFQPTFLCAACDVVKHPWAHLHRRQHAKEGCWVPMRLTQGFSQEGQLHESHSA